MNMILHPGEYFIELEFDRPVDPAVLHRALTSMGFGVVVFDQSLPSVEVGAASFASAASSFASARSALSSVAAAKPSIAPIQSRYAAPAVATVAARPSVVLARPTASSVVAKPVMASPTPSAAVKLADGGMPVALKSSATLKAVTAAFATKTPGLSTTPVSTRPAVSPAYVPTKTPVATAPSSEAFPGDVPASPTPTSASPASPASPEPPAPPEPKAAFQAPSGGGGGGGSSSSSEEAAPSPEPEQAYSPPPSPEPQAAVPSPEPHAPRLTRAEPERDPRKLTELWTKWKEWGSPFASGPSVSGTGEGDDDPLRFRVLARLDRPIALDDRPGMRWLFVKALSIPFLSDLVFQAHPHTLRQGALYELRFLSRAKSNRTRDSVKQELVDMGWKPVKLSAIKRNMTLPRRPASLTLWYGMAVWNRADSVIVNDDPFFFETVKEIRPQ